MVAGTYKDRPNGRIIFSIIGLSANLAAGSAFAQSADDAARMKGGVVSSSADPSNTLEEIIVTPQKRAEQLQSIPLSISALTGNALTAGHIADYDDISRAIPGLSFGTGGSEGLTNIEIRGVSSSSGSATVGIYLDDVSITVTNLLDGASQPKLFDMDRIEVLRGPQGTLYGASSMGGTIRFVTKAPSFQGYSADASTDVSYTDHGSVNYAGTIVGNFPIIDDRLAVRGSFGYVNNSGYIDNYSLGGQLQNTGTNSERDFTAKFATKYLASDDVTITPSVFFQQDSTGDTSVFYPSEGLFKQDKEVQESGRDTMLLPSLTVQADLGFADLTSVSGYFYRNYNRNEDGTYYNSTAFAQFFLDPTYPAFKAQNDALIGNLPSPVNSDSAYRQYSQEVRLTSKTPDETGIPIKWVLGIYYADQAAKNFNYQTIPGVNRVFRDIYGFSMEQSLIETDFGAPGLKLFPDDNAGSRGVLYDERQLAGFGQVDFDILPNLHGTVGLRYVLARESFNYYSYGFYAIGTQSPYNSLNHFYGLTPKFGVSYDVDATSSLYASATKGFRLGGSNSPIPFGPTSVCNSDFNAIGVTSQPGKYDDDKLWSYEVGSKNVLMDNKLSVNGAAYYIDWEKIQQQIYLPTCGIYYTANVGSAESYGAELEVKYKVQPGLTLGATGSVNHAVITSSANADTAAVGQHVLNSPSWTLTASADYQWPLTGELSGFVRADYDWVGDSYGSFTVTNSDYHDPAYGVLNASIGVSSDNWEVSLYGKNIANDSTIIQRPQINTVIEAYTLRPLTVGLTGKYHFD
jgi:iron complex outermembrane receptor protein